MRAHFVERLELREDYIFSVDESLHHLLRVVRIQVGERLLLLNGKGVVVTTKVHEISKKELKLKTDSVISKKRSYHFDLALGMPKREALELSLRQATELGFENIYLIKSDHSQMKFPDKERMEKLLVSALEQSNAAFKPNLTFIGWNEIIWDSYQEIVLLDSQTNADSPLLIKSKTRKLLIVGPEGGFSIQELSYLHTRKEIKVISLPTPILRTPTAVATGAGIMIQSLLY